MGEKANRVTVLLIDEAFSDFDSIVTNASHRVEIPELGTFFSKPSAPRPPDWATDFFGADFVPEALWVSSACGLLLVPMDCGGTQRIFALTFGTGRFLIEDRAIEERFGLRVVLNTVLNNTLKSIDKTSLGYTAKQSREQISGEGELTAFGIDIEQDLVNSATGRSKLEIFGKTITGKDALSATVKRKASDIKEFLEACWSQYQREDYLENFDWIDQVKDIRNKGEKERLDAILLAKLNSEEFDRIWVVPPEIVDWSDAKGFRYGAPKRGELFADLSIQELTASLRKTPIEREHLGSVKVHLISVKTDKPSHSWPAYKCLYAEVVEDNKLYMLNSGKWYEVEQSFVAKIEAYFHGMPESEIDFIEFDESYGTEGGYNQALSQSIQGAFCFDQKNITYGGGHSKIEFCDVYSPDRKIIHVKRYSGSSQLSHLFSQGLVSGELFISDEVFRDKVRELTPSGYPFVPAGMKPKAEDYEIVFAIISKSKKDLDIPFFSKVTLKNASTSLSNYGYNVSIKKIPTYVEDSDSDDEVIET